MKSLSARRLLLLCTALAIASVVPALALQPPAGKAILAISGNIGETNGSHSADFDLAMLEQLPQKTFTTATPWDKYPITFSGPLLRDVLAAVKAKGSTIKATAVNDYKTSIPLTDAYSFDVVLALKMNGQPIPVRTKGPLFIVYPYDAKPELRSKTYYDRSAWQVKSLDIQ